MNRNEQRSLIIGGTKGLGLEIVRESSVRGIRAIAVGRSFDDFEKARQEAPADFQNVECVKGDVTRPDTSLDALGVGRIEEATHLFLVAGNFSKRPFGNLTWNEIESLYQVHLIGPRKFLNSFHCFHKTAYPLAENPGAPYHLVMISSTSSWRMRENEAVYAEVQAAKAHFTRQFAVELARDLPGSKTTLVCPGGMATPNFWKDTGQDISKFMDPRAVAKIIWDRVEHQVSIFDEMHILRIDSGEPIVQLGQKTPEAPALERVPKPEPPGIYLVREGDTKPPRRKKD